MLHYVLQLIEQTLLVCQARAVGRGSLAALPAALAAGAAVQGALDVLHPLAQVDHARLERPFQKGPVLLGHGPRLASSIIAVRHAPFQQACPVGIAYTAFG
jgi:hypothetical protein